MEKQLEKLVEEANKGDKIALEKVVIAIKDLVYNLALRMLLYPADAQDATQEILVKIVTHLSTFQARSKFTTWVYRLATNYLLTQKGKQSNVFRMSFENYGKLIDAGQSSLITYTHNKGEQLLLEEEVKVSCTHGMLLCLSEQSRMVYILGTLLEFTSLEGGQILGITPENFRKQLSRSRAKLRNFMEDKCGLANPKNPCRCAKKIDHLIKEKIIDPNSLRFATQGRRSIELLEKINKLEKSAAIFRSTGAYETPEEIVRQMKEVINML